MDNKIITICGSMRYAKEMMKITEDLELKHGYVVIQCVYNTDSVKYDEESMKMLDQIHRKKIDISDAIYVVNINGYIGNNTKNEIQYALKNGKKVIYHVQEHQMRLDKIPFEMIDKEEKLIEYRLNDEKRQQLRIGDVITFTNVTKENQKLSVVIINLVKYDDLFKMYSDTFNQHLFKDYKNPQEAVDATTYYTNEEIKKYGCLAIHIKKL